MFNIFPMYFGGTFQLGLAIKYDPFWILFLLQYVYMEIV